jgi:predicted anti-sigma-YlaC factor YlaD
MSCDRVQEQLLLYLGQQQPPEELRQHLAECPACRSLWRELSRLEQKLGSDELFYPGDTDVERLVSKVDAAVRSGERARKDAASRVRKIWLTYVPVAAVAALVLGVAIGWYVAERTVLTPDEAPSAAEEVSFTGLTDEDFVQLDDDAVSALLYELTTRHPYEAGEWLLDDLTEEELKYLEERFDVGDLL